MSNTKNLHKVPRMPLHANNRHAEPSGSSRRQADAAWPRAACVIPLARSRFGTGGHA